MRESVILPGHGSEAPIVSQAKLLEKNIFRLRTTDNGNHIRQMCSLFAAEVKSISRTKILNIELGRQPLNSFRPIKDEELKEFLTILKLA